MKINLAISPCPNDTFMFYGLLHEKSINTIFDIDYTFADIEELNKLAIEEEIDVCKISYNAYPLVAEKYQILDSGSALGRNCGPLLIAKNKISENRFSKITVAIPGKNTTANFLLRYAYPQIHKKEEVLFSEIENAVLNNKYDGGLIIHENRFTYQAKGLIKIMDLGEFWEKSTGHPIPLGCIVVKRTLPEEIKKMLSQAIKSSIEYSYTFPDSSKGFVQENAQEMDSLVMQNHINLYVNKFSISLGEEGKNAVIHLFREKMKQENKNFALDNTFVGN